MIATRTRTLAAWALFAALLIVTPFVFPSRTGLTLFNAVGVNIVFALSYNMLLGQGGMLSFGHAVYFASGGYAAIHTMIAVKNGLSFPIFLVPLVAFAAGLGAGALFGYPSCRRSGTPFAMISLGLGELMAALAFTLTGLFGGEEGLSADRSAGPSMLGLSLGPIGNVVVFIAFWVLVSALLMFAFTQTPLGRLSNAVRDNPQRVAFVGYDPARLRYIVFMIAGGFAGLAGGMAAVTFELFSPESFGAPLSGAVIVMTFIGGTASFFGPAFGAVTITLMRSLLSDYTDGWQLYVGLLFVVIVMFAPRGFAGLFAAFASAAARRDTGALMRTWLGGAGGWLLLFCGFTIATEMVLRLQGGKPLRLLGLGWLPAQPLPWIVAALLAAAGIALLRPRPRAEARPA